MTKGLPGSAHDPVADDERTTDRVLTAVGSRLRSLRRQRGGTLAQPSEEAGISVSTLSRLESGHQQARPRSG